MTRSKWFAVLYICILLSIGVAFITASFFDSDEKEKNEEPTIPVSVVSDLFDCEIIWDAEKESVIVFDNVPLDDTAESTETKICKGVEYVTSAVLSEYENKSLINRSRITDFKITDVSNVVSGRKKIYYTFYARAAGKVKDECRFRINAYDGDGNHLKSTDISHALKNKIQGSVYLPKETARIDISEYIK